MEPKFPAPSMNPEYGGSERGFNVESLPLPPAPETGLEHSERPVEQQGETVSAAASIAALPTPVTLPQVPSPVVNPDPTSGQATSLNPSVAGDDDLIEKEWVDKAKQIIAETKNDPRRREEEVGKLQVDYLQKRYGKVLGASDASIE